jgi:hypothetical protein
MSNENLCLSIYFDNNVLGPYSFYFDKKINNYFSWFNSENDLKIKWNEYNNYWEVINSEKIINGEIRNYSDIWLPIGNWKIIGLIPNAYAEVTVGNCDLSPIKISGKVNDNTCNNKCNGSIIVSALGDNRPYLYSINNGVTFQGSPIFGNLCQNSYDILCLAGSGAVTSKKFDVGFKNNNIIYNLTLNVLSTLALSENTRQLSWDFDASPNLVDNEIIDLVIGVELETDTYEPGSGNTLNSINVYTKNSPTFTGLTQLNPTITNISSTDKNRDLCFPNKVISSFTGMTYSTSVNKGTILSGISTSIIYDFNKEISENGCATKILQKNNIRILSASIRNCECCDVFIDTTKIIEINKHER